jgi:hypothetical protein
VAVQPERRQQLLVQVTGPFVERPDGVCAEPLTKVNEQVEPVQAQALKQVDLEMRNQGLGLNRNSARVGTE